MPEGAPPVLDVRDLRVVFRTRVGDIHAVNDVSFSLRAGELLGVVGESGSGKSVTMMSLLGLLPSPPAVVTGRGVMFEGKDLLRLPDEEMRTVRGGRIGFVFQDPMTSLNPVFTVGFQIMEPLRKHLGMSKRQARARAAELLALVGIPAASARLDDYPHQFSGGMRQRVMIAIALACDPKVLIADEPTTALDVTIQAQILELMSELREKLGMAVIWITHDLGVIAGIADRVIVMYGGQVVEHAPAEDLFEDPRHPYTQALLTTVPKVHGERARRLTVIQGQPPILGPSRTSAPSRTAAPSPSTSASG
ncbi:Oligopeptide transport ATP-binding protein OppD [Rubellimicrobium mesophilum DSM 19309]|uniref:Oligopeptide transport ATP-binding protein OppD n=1 Tax=Rubellimicrobium mesophilum DSM 19309 TaxID=442562 RepID=A0A017HRX5_9RHOB|nr:Oligopeptide transport ATP-binding protein OppD [Rubellimicrobium mesophilum DSM 19309]